MSESRCDWKTDDRPAKGLWRPGSYVFTCQSCSEQAMGDKCAVECGDCAYSKSASDSAISHFKGLVAKVVSEINNVASANRRLTLVTDEVSAAISAVDVARSALKSAVEEVANAADAVLKLADDSQEVRDKFRSELAQLYIKYKITPIEEK